MQTRKMAVGKDPILIEKMIIALTLVENLRLSGLNFIFKGSTSLTLLLGKPSRFSIDIDIVLAKPQNLLPFFESVVDQGAFYRYEENRRLGELPEQHYKFFSPQSYKIKKVISCWISCLMNIRIQD